MTTTRIRRPSSRLAAGLLGGMLAAWLTVPLVALADESAGDVEMQDEAWFFQYRQPAEQLPDEIGDAVTDPTGNEADAIAKATVRDATGEIYTGEFLRVGTNLGEEEARTYITLPTAELGDGLDAIITGGTITLVAAPTSPEEPPEDVDPEAEDGDNAAASDQRNVDNADMVACLTLGFVAPDLAGDWSDRPEIDCDVRSPLEPAENPEIDRPTWTVDLEPFTSTWEDPMSNHGIAIVPNPGTDANELEQSWHVAFPNRFNNLASPPPLADVTYRQQEVPGFDDDFDDAFEDGFDDDFDDELDGFDDEPEPQEEPPPQQGDFSTQPETGEQTSAPASSTDFDVSGAPAATEEGFVDETAEQPEVAEEEPVEDETAVAERVAAAPPDPRTNPALALVPLVGLGLAALLGYSLTRQPELAVEREGAVSKLMRRRTGGPAA